MANGIHFEAVGVSLPHLKRRVLSVFIKRQLGKHGKQVKSVTFIFCNDDYILEINKNYLQHDDYTDIITFDLSEEGELIADIFISVERVRENAKINFVAFDIELYRVMFHGLLHLCGFGDKTNSEIKAMRLRENEWIKLFLFHVKQESVVSCGTKK